MNIKKDNVIKAYKKADDCAKKVLEDIFGKETFEVKIETVEDALDFLGEQDEDVMELRKMENAGFSERILDRQRLELVIKALNGGKFNTMDDTWYYCYFTRKDGKLAFGDYFWAVDHGTVPAHLTLKNNELATYCGRQFIDLYNKVYLP